MGCLIEWQAKNAEASYDTVRIYRATSESGSYSQIASQTISNISYYDIDGTTSHWYKVDFYNTSELKSSALSNAIQGGKLNNYCSVQEIRDMTNITSDDLTDTEVCKLIVFACRQLNHDISVYHYEEEIRHIDYIKENDIDGTNTTYYVLQYPIGDMNGDNLVTISDLEVYTVDSDGTKIEVIVSSLTPNIGQFILETAPASGLRVFVTYRSVPLGISVSDPHYLIKQAAIMLTAHYGYLKINTGKSPDFRFGSQSIKRDMNAGMQYYKRYQMLLQQINSRMTDIKRNRVII